MNARAPHDQPTLTAQQHPLRCRPPFLTLKVGNLSSCPKQSTAANKNRMYVANLPRSWCARSLPPIPEITGLPLVVPLSRPHPRPPQSPPCRRWLHRRRRPTSCKPRDLLVRRSCHTFWGRRARERNNSAHNRTGRKRERSISVLSSALDGLAPT